MAWVHSRVQPRKKEQVGCCNKAFCRICCWSRDISVATWFRFDITEKRIHNYVLFWLIVLISLLFVPTSGWPGWILVGVALYRLQDLTFSTLDNALQLTKRSELSDNYDGLTSVVLALVNIIQIVLIFAIAYLVLTGHNPRSFSNRPTGRLGEFFLSWISLPPLGGDASPRSTMAEILTIIEEGTGLVIIVIAINRFLTYPKRPKEDDDAPDSLSARANLASSTGRAGDAAGARDQLAALLPVCERVLGAEHPDTLTARAKLAYWTGQAEAGTGRQSVPQ